MFQYQHSLMTWMIWGYHHDLDDLGNFHIPPRDPQGFSSAAVHCYDLRIRAALDKVQEPILSSSSRWPLFGNWGYPPMNIQPGK